MKLLADYETVSCNCKNATGDFNVSNDNLNIDRALEI